MASERTEPRLYGWIQVGAVMFSKMILAIALIAGGDPWPTAGRADPWPSSQSPMTGESEKPEHVIVFKASWCGPCEAWISSEGDALRKAGWRLKIVDVDESPDVAAKYGVTSVPTFVARDGGEPRRHVGRLGLSEFGDWFYARKTEQAQQAQQFYYKPKRGLLWFLR